MMKIIVVLLVLMFLVLMFVKKLLIVDVLCMVRDVGDGDFEIVL